MTTRQALVLLLGSTVLAGCDPAAVATDVAQEPTVVAATAIDQGRYLAAIGGCNDCHSPGYNASGGTLPESQRLMGNPVGFAGPWGVTYAHNLRITVAGMSEDAWVEMLETRRASPPMPWPSVRAMSEADKRAVYRYIKSLGAGGVSAPTALPPGVRPTTPVENMVPVPPDA